MKIPLIALQPLEVDGRTISRQEIFAVNAITAAALVYRGKARFVSERETPKRRRRRAPTQVVSE